jgi:hypothetical protein
MIRLNFRQWMGAADIATLTTLPALCAEELFVPTRVAKIDAMRRDFLANPTTPENASHRHALIFSWVRHLVHRNMQMSTTLETAGCRENFGRAGRPTARCRPPHEHRI